VAQKQLAGHIRGISRSHCLAVGSKEASLAGFVNGQILSVDGGK